MEAYRDEYVAEAIISVLVNKNKNKNKKKHMSDIAIVDTKPAADVSPLFELLSLLKQDVAGNNLVTSVTEAFRKKNVDEKKAKMAEQLATAVQNFTAIDRALKAIKPVALGFDAEGKAVSEVYSKAQTEEKKKLKEAYDKALKILNQGLTSGDFSQFGNIKAPAGGKAEAPASDESAG